METERDGERDRQRGAKRERETVSWLTEMPDWIEFAARSHQTNMKPGPFPGMENPK